MNDPGFAYKKRKNVMVNKKKAQTEYEKTKKLSLDDIENEMESIAMDQDISKVFMNSQRMEMLEKVANFKIKRMQLDIEKEKEVSAASTITVNFTSSKTSDAQDRISKLEQEVIESKGKSNDA